MNDTSGGARNATARGSGSGDAKPSSRGGSDRSAPRGVANRAAQLRVAEKKRQAEAGYLGRERPIAADLPPYWSTSKHGMPFTATANPRASASATTKPRSSTDPRRASVVAAATKPRGVRASLRALDAPMTTRERLRAVMSLPPNEQILALVSGLDRDPEAPPWTGDDLVRWRRDPERCVRRAVAALEDRMRRSLAATVARENARSMSPAWNERDFLTRVFMRVDKNRHGRLTGDCDVAMFMTAWGRRPDRDEHRHDEHENDPEYDAEIVHDVDDVDESHMDDVDESQPQASATSPRRPRRPAVTFSGGEGAKKTRDSRLGARASRPSSASLAAKSLGSPAKPREKDDTFEFVRLLPRDAGDGVDGSFDADVSQAAAAALFVKHGYDRDGFMPYEVFIQSLLTSPSRLLGMEPLMDCDSRHGYEADDDFHHDGKIIYPKCRSTVFPPSEFDARNVARSGKAPDAELELDHVYGYAGLNNTAPNIFYLGTGEICYYTAAVGVVLDKEKLEKREKCQRFFFGHDDDIKCMAIHPNREWVATGQLGRRPYVCVWDAITTLQLQRIAHPAGMRGVVALGFSRADGGDHLTAVNSDNSHTVMVWRWSTRGDDAAIDRAKPIPAWSFGPAKRVDGLEFYDEEEGSGAPRASKAATAAPSKAALAGAGSGPPTARTSKSASKSAAAEAAARESMDAHADNWKFGDGSYELVGEGQGINGLPPMVNGVVWNPFPGMEEFVTYGVKHIKVWRRARFGDDDEGGAWVGEMGRRNDGRRPADFSAADPRTVNTGQPGGGYVPAPTPETGTPASSVPGSPSKEVTHKSEVATSKKKTAAVTQSMTSLSNLPKKKNGAAGIPGTPAKSTPKSTPSRAVRASLSKLSVRSSGAKLPLGRSSSASSASTGMGGENVVSAAFVRRDVVVTGFPDGALGVWVITRLDANGDAVTDPTTTPVFRWKSELVQRIADAHAPGSKIHLNDGTTTYSGVRCLEPRPDGLTMLSGGADGWVHTWEVADGDVVVVGRPKTDGPGRAPLEKRRAVLLRKLAASAEETDGPHSFRFASPYPREGPLALRSLDCRPMGIPPPGKKKVPSKDRGKVPREFVFGTNRCEIWEVEFKKGPEEPPTTTVQVHGHLADLHAVAAHPRDPNVFASAADADRVFLWSASDRNLTRTSPIGLEGRSIAFSADPVPKSAAFPGWQPFVMKRQGTSNKFKPEKADAGHHLCVGGKRGGIAVMDGVTLQPLVKLAGPSTAVDDVKYCGGPRQMLAAGSHDLAVDVYDVCAGYAHLSRCQGHQATITNLDWSLPDVAGRRILQSTCASYELLYWDPTTGRQVLKNQRDTAWDSWTCALGFPVMGVWADGSDGTDINAVDRAHVGQPSYDDVAGTIARPEGADGLENAGFVVTADDFGRVKLFNYPCVFNDAPYREYKGHASHVMCARFSCDDARVYTAGGADRAMMQFVTRGVKPDEPKPAYEPPPEPARVWGPIDGGKNYGWIDASVEDDPNAEEKRIAPAKPQATMAFAADAVRAAEAEAEAAKRAAKEEAAEREAKAREADATNKGVPRYPDGADDDEP